MASTEPPSSAIVATNCVPLLVVGCQKNSQIWKDSPLALKFWTSNTVDIVLKMVLMNKKLHSKYVLPCQIMLILSISFESLLATTQKTHTLNPKQVSLKLWSIITFSILLCNLSTQNYAPDRVAGAPTTKHTHTS